MKLETLNKIIKAFECTSTDLSRLNITCVNVVNKGNNLINIMATDGRKAIINSSDDPEFATLIDNKELNFSPEYLPILKLIAKTYKGIERVISQFKGNHLEIQEHTIPNVLQPDINWPREALENLIPVIADDNKVQLSFNAEYLLDMVKALKDNKEDPIVLLEFDYKNKTNPILVKVKNQVGVLMPCRLP